jgi:putative redox protein
MMEPDPRQPTVPPPTVHSDADWVVASAGNSGFRTEIAIGQHGLVADEPLESGGTDDGPSPYELLLAALGSCTAMTMRMYASRKGWPLAGVIVRLRDYHTHAADCENCETKSVGLRRLERQIELHGELTDEQRARLMLIADRCPVKQTLDRGIEIVTHASAGALR